MIAAMLTLVVGGVPRYQLALIAAARLTATVVRAAPLAAWSSGAWA